MNEQKENPQETGLASEVSQGSEIDAFPARIERYSTARGHARKMADFLAEKIPPKGPEKSLEKEARKMALCGEWLLFRQYYTVNEIRLVKGYFCQLHMMCALCAIRRGTKALKAYLDKFQVVQAMEGPLRASLVTLTVKNGDDLAERFEHLRSSLKTLNQRRKDAKRKRATRSEWSKVLGLVGSYEIKRGARQKLWHPHTHMICLHKEEISQEALSNEWRDITGDSHQVDVTPLQHPEDPAQDFVEVFKYAVKMSTMEHGDVLHAWRTLKGKRLMFSTGLFRGVEVPEGLTDEPLEDLPFVELFYRYIPGSGYNLSRYSHVSNGGAPIQTG
jgi:hypothetical protein